jgi:hypothetical protein
MHRTAATGASREPRVLARAPEELTAGRLRRLGEGIGKVVYASPHWVVKRGRTPFEVVALIVLWRILKKLARILPGPAGKRLLKRPAIQIRLLRLVVQAAMAVIPKAVWFTARIQQMWKQYHFRSLRGELLARQRLAGTGLVPERVEFPPTRVRIGGWPGWLTVSEATERVETTLYERLAQLARAGRFDELERWLERFLELRQRGWSLGLFSVDAHLKNFGVIEDRVVLLDAGGLTNRWPEIEEKLVFEEVVAQPHIQLGLGPLLAARPEIAERFNARWKAMVNRDVVRELWPGEPAQSPPPAGEVGETRD